VIQLFSISEYFTQLSQQGGVMELREVTTKPVVSVEYMTFHCIKQRPPRTWKKAT